MTGTTLWDLVAWRAARTPGATALIQGAESARHDRVITFGALHRRAERVAAGLYERGVRPGSRVVWQLPTRIETVLLSLALARIGAVQSPVVPLYRDHEVGSGAAPHPRRLLRRPRHLARLRPPRDGPPAGRRAARPLTVIDAYDTLPDADPAVLPPPPADARRRSAGSTGPPAPPRAPRASSTPTTACAPAAAAWATRCAWARPTSARWPSRTPMSRAPTTPSCSCCTASPPSCWSTSRCPERSPPTAATASPSPAAPPPSTPSSSPNSASCRRGSG